MTAVIDLTSEFNAPRQWQTIPYLNLQVLDLTAPTQVQIRCALEFISKHAQNGIVYVHCKVGYSRSAVIVGASLLSRGRAENVNDALMQLTEMRPGIVVRPEAVRALMTFEESLVAHINTT